MNNDPIEVTHLQKIGMLHPIFPGCSDDLAVDEKSQPVIPLSPYVYQQTYKRNSR